METEDDPNFRNSKLAAAPHTVHMMDSGFLVIVISVDEFLI